MTFSLTPADGTFLAFGSADSVRLVFNATPFPGVSPKTFWELELSSERGTTIAPGNYQSATRSQSPKRPGLDIVGDGRGCNTVTGKFTVYEATFDAAGNVVAFAADAEQHCEGATPALRVHIRFNSEVPLQLGTPQAMAGLPQEVSEHALVTLDGSQSYDPDGEIVSWHWSQIGGPATTIESPHVATTQFRAPDVEPGGADMTFQLDVRDNAGNAASAVTTVHVFDRRDRRNLLVWRSPPGDYIGGGVPLTFTSADGAVTLSNAYAEQMSIQAFFEGADNWWSLDD